jgi:hypothetical protein
MSSIYDFQETAVYDDEPMEKPDNSVFKYLGIALALFAIDMVPTVVGVLHYLNR